MKLSKDIYLGKSLRLITGNDAHATSHVEMDRARQTATANEILARFYHGRVDTRREIAILAVEVGLGKTFVALAVAVSLLDAIRRGEAYDGVPSKKPVVLVLVPSNDALYTTNGSVKRGHSRRTAPELTERWTGSKSALQSTNPASLEMSSM